MVRRPHGTVEVNFDGIPGPTHNYAGLSYGNIASMHHGMTVSNPRAALMQGLDKMKLLHGMGLVQAVLPPHARPDVMTLRRLGFRGKDDRILEKAAKEAPELLAACSSSSAMWTANAATVSPLADTADGRVHFTPANLVSQFHRSIEAEFTSVILKVVFKDDSRFVHHPPLPPGLAFSDEGAANHTRLCMDHGGPGLELFVYGRRAFAPSTAGPNRFPARQTEDASRAIARLHRLDPERTILVRQNPAAIDSGVFHNDVISVGNENVFLFHEAAFEDRESICPELARRFERECGGHLFSIPAEESDFTVEDAVRTYVFNSQLVTLPSGEMCLIAPVEAEENDRTRRWLESVVAAENPIESVEFIDVRQSMKNGGGPACLRLRVVLTREEMEAAHRGILFDDRLYGALVDWGNRHYRDRIHPSDLADPALLVESRAALDELTGILALPPIYPFQTSP